MASCCCGKFSASRDPLSPLSCLSWALCSLINCTFLSSSLLNCPCSSLSPKTCSSMAQFSGTLLSNELSQVSLSLNTETLECSASPRCGWKLEMQGKDAPAKMPLPWDVVVFPSWFPTKETANKSQIWATSEYPANFQSLKYASLFCNVLEKF